MCQDAPILSRHDAKFDIFDQAPSPKFPSSVLRSVQSWFEFRAFTPFFLLNSFLIPELFRRRLDKPSESWRRWAGIWDSTGFFVILELGLYFPVALGTVGSVKR